MHLFSSLNNYVASYWVNLLNFPLASENDFFKFNWLAVSHYHLHIKVEQHNSIDQCESRLFMSIAKAT